jgi:hypothetical protein
MAEQTEPVKRPAAIKILKPGLDAQQKVERFEAERTGWPRRREFMPAASNLADF